MELSDSLLLIFCSLGVAQSLFFAIFLFTYREGSVLSNRILAILLIALSIRLIKSIAYYFFTLPDILMNFGFAAHAAIAPLLYCYIRYYKNGSGYRPVDFLHFVPFVLILLGSFWLTESFWLPMGYALLLYQTLAYLILSWFHYFKMNKTESTMLRLEQYWLVGLLITISAFGVGYFSNFILGIANYMTGPILYSALIYLISYLGLRYYHSLFGLASLKKPAILNDAEVKDLLLKVEAIIQSDKPHLDPSLTLPKLAKTLAVPPYKLSQFINQHYEQNFSDWINQFRIQEARQALTDPAQQNKKIAAIAFESGFNTLSAFNNAFKKSTLKTPSEFRKTSTLP